MAKYTSDANLIKGAAAVGRSMMPADLSGLDKVTKAGTDMMTETVKEYEIEQKKIEEEAKALEEKNEQINKEWADIASKVYENAGSFLKVDGGEYKMTVNDVKDLKEDWIKANESNDPELIAAVNTKFNNIATDIEAHKTFRLDIADDGDGGLSDSVKGDNKAYLTSWLKEDYTISKKDGEKVYTVDSVGKTMKEIKAMADPKDIKPFVAFGSRMSSYSKAKNIGSRSNLELDIKNNVIPDNVNGLSAFLNDPEFGSGQTFSQVLNEEGNRKAIEEEIKRSIFDDGDGIITQAEWDKFNEVIVDRHHPFWKDNGGETAWKKNSGRIATEQLSNAIENEHARLHPEEELTWAQKLQKAKYFDYVNEESGEENKFGLNLKKNYYTIQTSGGTSYIDGQAISNSVETFKAVQDAGSGTFTGYDKKVYLLENGKWTTYNADLNEEKGGWEPSNAKSIFSKLNWSNNPKIMEYLKIQKEGEKEVKAVPNLAMQKELKALEMRKGRYIRKEAPMRPEDYEKLVQDIKAKYIKK